MHFVVTPNQIKSDRLPENIAIALDITKEISKTMLAHRIQSFLEPETEERSIQYYEGEFDALIGIDPKEVAKNLENDDYAEGFVSGSVKRIYNLALAKYSQK